MEPGSRELWHFFLPHSMYRVYRSARGTPGGLRAKRPAQVYVDESFSMSADSEPNCVRVLRHPRLCEPGNKQGRITPRNCPDALAHVARNFGYALRSHATAGPPASESSPLRIRQWPADSRNEHEGHTELNLSARPAKSPADRRGRASSPARRRRKAHSGAPGSRPRLLALLPASEMSPRESRGAPYQMPTAESSRATIPKPRSCLCGARPLARGVQIRSRPRPLRRYRSSRYWLPLRRKSYALLSGSPDKDPAFHARETS